MQSPFPEYITDYILSRKPTVFLYIVTQPEDPEYGADFTALTKHDGQAREVRIEPTCSVFYQRAMAYINFVYQVEPLEHIACFYWSAPS